MSAECVHIGDAETSKRTGTQVDRAVPDGDDSALHCPPMPHRMLKQ